MTAASPRARPGVQAARRAGATALLVGALLAGVPPADAAAQVFHRSRCSRPNCPAEVFREEVERMTLTEGPMASDRDEQDLRELKQRIVEELGATPEDPSLWLALSEAEYGLGDPVPAMAAASRALELGADSSLALRARAAARMRMAGGEFEGATLYLEALSRMTRVSRPRFFADVMPLLTQFELDWWRGADLETLRPWVRRYWEHRAAVAGVRLEDRLVEHLRRVAAASRLYAPPGTGSGAPGDADVLRSRELNMLPYDDRGLVYVRRGPPHQELRVPGEVFSDMPSETWLYGSVDGSVDAFHFSRGGWGGSGFRLVTAPACDPSYAGSSAGTLSNLTTGWVLTAVGASGEADRLAVSCFGGDARTLRANARLNAMAMRRETLRALAVESPREPFHRALPAFFDHYMFRGEGDATEVITPIVVPVEPGATQPVELLVTFADRGGGVVRRESTSGSARAMVQPSVISGGESWGVAYVRTIAKPANDVAFRVVVRDPSDPNRGGMWGDSTAVRSFEAHGLKMSDVVVAGPGPATWTRGATRLFLLPARSFVPGATATVFYELYDLRPGATYRTELTLHAEKEGLAARLWRSLTGSGQIRIRFDSQVPENVGATLQELRTLNLPDGEGRYTLSVRVTSDGMVAEATRSVVISRDAAQPTEGASPAGAPGGAVDATQGAAAIGSMAPREATQGSEGREE